jgi:hypothetical protein
MRQLGFLAILIITTGGAMAQQRPKYEIVPDDTVLLAIASQANCPLKIENASFLKRVDQPGLLIKYRLRNVSNKPISFISVMIQNSSSSFMPLGRLGKLLPNQSLDSPKLGIDYDLVNSKSVRKPEAPGQRLKTLYILLVEKVEFTDGTTYEDTRTENALFRFFLDN